MRHLRGLRAGDLGLAALLLAGITIVALLKNGRPDGGVNSFASTDFRSGGYAAWYLLMEREGVAVERFERRPADLDAAIDTLIAAYPPGPPAENARRPADRAALAQWVRAGGRLIVLGTADPFTGEGPRLHGLRTAYGRGAIVAIRDPEEFDNAAIARGDNARLAFALARPRAPGGIVAFDEALHGTIVDRRWWNVIGLPQRVALGGIAFAVLIALIGGALRLGPPVSLRAAREPASDEFVAAVAALYARSHARRAALQLFAAGARDAGGNAAQELRRLAERPAPSDRDLIAGAALARSIREGS
jgi:hypothetical protein